MSKSILNDTIKESSYRNIKLLGWFNFLTDFRIYTGIAVLYFAEVTGSYTTALSIFSIMVIATSIFEVPTGVISDAIGRKKTIIFGQFFAILALFFYAFSGNQIGFIIGAVLQGLTIALFSGNNTAFLYDTLKENQMIDEFPKLEGRNNAMFQYALAISALLAGIMLLFTSYQPLFILSIVPQVLAFFLSFWLVETKSHSSEIAQHPFSILGNAIKRFLSNARLRKVSFVQMYDYGIDYAVKYLFPLFTATVWAVWLIPIANAVKHLLVALGHNISHWCIRKYGEFFVLKTTKFTNSSLYLFFTSFPTIFSPLVNLVEGFLWGVGSIAQTNLLQRDFSDKERATMGSLVSLGGSIMFAIFAFGLGLIADAYGPATAMVTASLMMFGTFFMYWLLGRKAR